MPARQPTASGPGTTPTRPVTGLARADWCWCGNRAVARCPGCSTVLCERHRLQEGMPPPQVLAATSEDAPLTWPYGWEDAWHEIGHEVDLGWLAPRLAEQLFHAGFGAQPELALCQPCRVAAGLEMIGEWREMVPPKDGWQRALWLLEHGFEADRVEAAVDAGPQRRATVRFLDAARAAGADPPAELTLIWARDRHGVASPISRTTGWVIDGAIPDADPAAGNGHTPRLFVTTDGETYVFAVDQDASVGRVQTTKRGRTTEYRRLADDHWNPTRLAIVAYQLRHD